MKLFGSSRNNRPSGMPSNRNAGSYNGRRATYGNGENYGGYRQYDYLSRREQELRNDEIEREIAAYQRKKRRRYKIIFTVILMLAAGVVTAYALLVRPPDQVISIPTPIPTLRPPDIVDNPGEEPSRPDDEGEDPNSLRRKGTYTFVVVGQDGANANTDTMMVGMLDTEQGNLNVVSIPRDTLVDVPWEVKKINSIYPFGAGIDATKEEKADALIEGLSDFIGFPVDCYICVDLEAFEAIVEAIGGVDFDIPVRMKYSDPLQDLYIDFQPGLQHLNGEDALKVVRFREYPDGDIGRIRTQQEFLKEAAKQILRLENISKIDEFASIFKEYVDTNLDLMNIIWLGQEILKLNSEDITFLKVPGDEGPWVGGDTIPGGTFISKGSYVSTYVDEWIEMINDYLNPYKIPITENYLNIITYDRETGKYNSTSGRFAG